jgi:hypothetical protein
MKELPLQLKRLLALWVALGGDDSFTDVIALYLSHHRELGDALVVRVC